MNDPVAQFRKERVEALGAIINACVEERTDTASEVDNIIARLHELYFFAPDMRGLVEHIKDDVAASNNVLEWARSANSAMNELPWGRVHAACERLLEQPPLYRRDWSTGPIQLQYANAVTGWIDIEEWAQRAKREHPRSAEIDDISILTGAYNVFEHLSTAMLKSIDTEGADEFGAITTAILNRPDARLDMLPAALTYFGEKGVSVLNVWPSQQVDFIAKLQEFATEGLFDSNPQPTATATNPDCPPQPSAGKPHRDNPATINLAKGANTSLTQQSPTLSAVAVGLGWDARTTSGIEFDLDASAIACGDDRRVISDAHFVFYNNAASPDGCIVHRGDNRTGVGDGDDEIIDVDLAQLPGAITHIFFTVSIYDEHGAGLTFGQVRNAFIRVVDHATSIELVRFDLTEDASSETAMVFGELYRRSGEWKFRAIGQGYATGLAGIAQDYGVVVD